MAIGPKNNDNRLSKPERRIFKDLQQQMDACLTKEQEKIAAGEDSDTEHTIILHGHALPQPHDKVLLCLRRKYIKAGWYDISFRKGKDGGTDILVVSLSARPAAASTTILPILRRLNKNLRGENKA